jgi:hypothetical protein
MLSTCHLNHAQVECSRLSPIVEVDTGKPCTLTKVRGFFRLHLACAIIFAVFLGFHPTKNPPFEGRVFLI